MSLSPVDLPNRFSFVVDNFGANPGNAIGTSVTPGASDAEGSWTQILSAVAQDIWEFNLHVHSGNTSTAAKRHVLDIGIDPAGGSSYTAIISNILCGAAGTLGTDTSPGHVFRLKWFIPSGSTVAVRIQGSNATAGTVRVAIRAYGLPSRPEQLFVAQYHETLGVTGSDGTTFTPGNAADGTWVDLGTTTRDLWWFQLCFQVDNGTITAEHAYIEIAHGDATNKHIIGRRQHGGLTSESVGDRGIMGNLLDAECFCPVKAGEHIYIRGRANNAPDANYEGAVVGLGG